MLEPKFYTALNYYQKTEKRFGLKTYDADFFFDHYAELNQNKENFPLDKLEALFADSLEVNIPLLSLLFEK